jgi:hypothetical protein
MEKVAGWFIRPEQREQAMQVERVRPGATPTVTRKAAAADGFSQMLETPPAGEAGEVSGGTPAGAAAAASPLTGLMSYEEACDRVKSDRQARRHGRAMLQALGVLQAVLLADGDTDAHTLSELALADLAAGMPEADDPVLRLILREIGVRAAVELARYEATPDISIG